MANDPKGFNKKGNVSIDKSADGWETNIRVGNGAGHTHTIIRNGQMIYDRGFDINGKPFTFINDQILNNNNAHGLFPGTSLPPLNKK